MATFPFRADTPARQRVLLMARHMFTYPSIVPDTLFSLDSNALFLKASPPSSRSRSGSGSGSGSDGPRAGWTRHHRPGRLLRALGPFPLGAHGTLEIAVRALRLRFASASCATPQSSSLSAHEDLSSCAVYEYVLTWRAPGPGERGRGRGSVVEVFEMSFVGSADAAGAGANRRAAREALARLCEDTVPAVTEAETAGVGSWARLSLGACTCVVL